MFAHITLGVLLSLAVSFLFSILATITIEKEIFSIESMDMLMIGVHALCVFLGSILAISKEQGRIAVITGAVTVCYLLMLVCINLLVFSDGFSGVGTGILGMLSGGLIATLLKSKMLGAKKHHKKMRSC